MKITSLSISNFRNHSESRLAFSERLNVLHGLNGAGKTSVLEAIAVACFSKSFLPANDQAIVQQGSNSYKVTACAFTDLGSPYKITVIYTTGFRKTISGTPGDGLLPKDIIGNIPLVILSPDFKKITFGSPQSRREFIDRIISQISKRYFEDLLTLKKCLRQRNNLLTQAKKDWSFDMQLLEPWTELFIDTGSDIILRRKRFVDSYQGYFLKTYSDISVDSEPVSLEYKPDSIPLAPTGGYGDKAFINRLYFDLWKKLSKAETIRGTTLFGPQKDDIEITVNGGVARDYASQGQHKTLLISLKFAEFNYLLAERGETPVILLDDIFSELDSERSRKVLEMIVSTDTQTFITSTDGNSIARLLPTGIDCRYFRIERGRVVNES